MANNVLHRLTENVNATTNDPTVKLDERLFEEAELVLPESLAAGIHCSQALTVTWTANM